MSKATKKRRSSFSRGSIALIATLLLASAALRVFSSATIVLAEGDLPSQLFPPTLPQAEPVAQHTSRAEVTDLLQALRKREVAVEEREMQLDVRAKSLEVAQLEIERRISALEAAEQRLSATLAHADTAAEDDLARLTAVYENMKPKDAAALFQAMEPDFAAGFLARMRPDAAAKILAGLEPQSAYSISAILAGRNANAPKN